VTLSNLTHLELLLGKKYVDLRAKLNKDEAFRQLREEEERNRREAIEKSKSSSSLPKLRASDKQHTINMMGTF
jgi:hypothetical protein